MDQELKGSAALQKDDVNILDAGDDSVTQEHANVLANLLQSLDAGSGGPGPVQSMMKAMGQEPPLLSSDAALANEEESSDDEE